MKQPTLVIVTGAPASGKSTLARALAEELCAPFLSKDEVKERLFEALPEVERDGDALDNAAFAVVLSVTGSNLAAGVPVLIESDFRADADLQPLRTLVDRHGARIVQVHCGGNPDRLSRKFADRARGGERHPVHDDEPEDAHEVREKVAAGIWDPLDLPGDLIQLKTDSQHVDAAAIAARIS